MTVDNVVNWIEPTLEPIALAASVVCCHGKRGDGSLVSHCVRGNMTIGQGKETMSRAVIRQLA